VHAYAAGYALTNLTTLQLQLGGLSIFGQAIRQMLFFFSDFAEASSNSEVFWT
jgi:hypothetical protein